MVHCVIFTIKRMIPELTQFDHPRTAHLVTDHAFCSAIERLGYDLSGYKDKALEEATAAGLRPVHHGGVIVTFLPAKGAPA